MEQIVPKSHKFKFVKYIRKIKKKLRLISTRISVCDDQPLISFYVNEKVEKTKKTVKKLQNELLTLSTIVCDGDNGTEHLQSMFITYIALFEDQTDLIKQSVKQKDTDEAKKQIKQLKKLFKQARNAINSNAIQQSNTEVDYVKESSISGN